MERNKGFIKGVLNNPLQMLDNSDWSNKLKATTVVSEKPKIILPMNFVSLFTTTNVVCNGLHCSVIMFYSLKEVKIAFHITNDTPYKRRHPTDCSRVQKPCISMDSAQPFWF